MNAKLVLLFSWFLGGWFILTNAEHVRSHNQQLGHHGGHSQNYNFAFRSKDQQEPTQCDWVCTPNSTANSPGNGLTVFYNGKFSLLAIWKQSSNLAVVFDYASNLTAIFNTQTRVVIVFNVQIKVVYSFKFGFTNFESYFRNLQSLTTIYKTAEKENNKIDISQALNLLLENFHIRLNSKETLQLIASFISSLNGDLKLMYQNSGSFKTHNSLQWFLKVNIAFGGLLKNAAGSNLKQHLKEVNLSLVFNSNSGVEALVALLSQIGQYVDLGREFKSILNSPEEIAKLLEDLSGGSHEELDGLITIVVNVVKVVSGNGSATKVISSIINYDPSQGGDQVTLAQVVDRFLKLAETQIQRYNTRAEFEAFVKFLKSINNNSFVFNNVDVSDLIKLLRWYKPQDAIATVIKLLSRFLPSKGVPQFMSFFLNLLNNTNSIGGLSKLLPGVDLSNFTRGGAGGSLLQQVLKGSNLTKLISGGSNSVISTLAHVPIIGNVITSISSGLGNGADVGQYLNASSILGEFKRVLGGGGLGNVLGIGSGIASGFQQGVNGVVQGVEHGIEDVLGLLPGKGEKREDNDDGKNENTSGGNGDFEGSFDIFGGFDEWFRDKHASASAKHREEKMRGHPKQLD